MPRGGARPGAGRPRKHPKGVSAGLVVSMETPVPPKSDAPPAVIRQPLEYMLSVMNDDTQHPDMRARMAVAAAPYVHPKAGEQGKKEQKNEAAKKVASRFTASAPPPRPGSAAH